MDRLDLLGYQDGLDPRDRLECRVSRERWVCPALTDVPVGLDPKDPRVSLDSMDFPELLAVPDCPA